MSSEKPQYQIQNFRYIPIDQIELWPEANVRRTDVLLDIDELASNIKAVGLQNPIVVQEEDRILDVVLHEKELYCSLDESQDCTHVAFCHALPPG